MWCYEKIDKKLPIFLEGQIDMGKPRLFNFQKKLKKFGFYNWEQNYIPQSEDIQKDNNMLVWHPIPERVKKSLCGLNSKHLDKLLAGNCKYCLLAIK